MNTPLFANHVANAVAELGISFVILGAGIVTLTLSVMLVRMAWDFWSSEL